MRGLRAGVALALTGRYAPMAAQAAAGLSAWAAAADVQLAIVDCGEDPARAADAMVGLAPRVDVLFGPYGSGAMRATAAAFAASHTVIWNHGGAAVVRNGARIVDVLAPAASYWTGLGEALAAAGADVGRAAILHAQSGFGREVASGAEASITALGARPLVAMPFDERSAARAAEAVVGAGVDVVVACGRFEDDVALLRALAGRVDHVGAVAAGVAALGDALGPRVVGLFGPSQWDGRTRPAGLGHDADYPAVQAFAAGMLAQAAVTRAGGPDPDAVWDAARAMREVTPLGPFAVDVAGRQIAHTPVIVRWEHGPDGPRRRVVWRAGERP